MLPPDSDPSHACMRLSRTAYLPVPDDGLNDGPERVNGDGKADACRGPRGRVDGRVHANQTTRTVQQRAARVARVNGRVRLDHVADGAACARWKVEGGVSLLLSVPWLN